MNFPTAGTTTLTTVQRVRWGIIGVGNVTERKSGPGFQQAERSELVAVMRRNGALAADYARRNGVPRWYDDADKLINDPGVDAVYIATPPDSHREYAVRVAKAGKPVYVEKPMARTALECAEMISACGYLADDGVACSLHGRVRSDGRPAKPDLCSEWPPKDKGLHPGCVFAPKRRSRSRA